MQLYKLQKMNANLLRTTPLFVLAACALCPRFAAAAHPLNTDDTGVQGKGNYQLELTLDENHDRDHDITNRTRNFSTTLSYGITDSTDLVLSLPYLRTTRYDPASLPSNQVERGKGDATLQVKWMFYDVEKMSFALKPGIGFHTGDANKGLGAGKTTYSVLLVATLEREPWSYDFNIGYTQNNSVDSAATRKNIFLASGAVTYQATERLRLLGDVGVATNPDRGSNSQPTYVLGGIIYSPSKNLDIDTGIQLGANKVAVDHIYKAGVTVRW